MKSVGGERARIELSPVSLHAQVRQSLRELLECGMQCGGAPTKYVSKRRRKRRKAVQGRNSGDHDCCFADPVSRGPNKLLQVANKAAGRAIGHNVVGAERDDNKIDAVRG